LLFQALDHKKDCVGYFADNHIHATGVVPNTGTTWELSAHMHGEVYELGRIYSHGAPLTDVCPEDMKAEWDRIKKALRSCLKAFRTAPRPELLVRCYSRNIALRVSQRQKQDYRSRYSNLSAPHESRCDVESQQDADGR